MSSKSVWVFLQRQHRCMRLCEVAVLVLLVYNACLILILDLLPRPSVQSFIGNASQSAAINEAPKSIAVPPSIDWSKFAYAQYVTTDNYLCNSVMFFETLSKTDSKASRVMMYPRGFLKDPTVKEADTEEGTLIIKARDQYNVSVQPIDIQHKNTNDATWADSFTKLLVFNQTSYSRVLSIDSDSLLLDHMDELFLLPPAPMAMSRAYWLYPEKEILSSQLMLVTPSVESFKDIQQSIKDATHNDYDVEIVNYLYRDSAIIIPHRRYDLLSAEFRSKNHTRYLGNAKEKWDPVAAYNEAKLIHFSDWPVAKPWLKTPESVRKKQQPECPLLNSDCPERMIWNNLYAEFRKRRRDICGWDV